MALGPANLRGAQRDGQPNAASGESSFAVTAPSLALPKGGGAIRGIGEKFAANPVTGTGSMSVPIATSPGRSGFGPQLSLSYDSGAGNGPFGFGWSLSLPSITRKTDKGLPQYLDAEDSDVFILSGAEDLVPVLAGPDGTLGRRDAALTVANRGWSSRIPRPPLPPAHRGALRAHRALDASSAHPAMSIGARSPRTTSSPSTGYDANSRIADPLDAEPHLQLADLRDARRQGQRRSSTATRRGRHDVWPGQVDPFDQAHERNRGPADDSRRTANRYLKRILLRQPHAAAGCRGPAPALPERPARSRRRMPTPTGCSRCVFDYGEHDAADADEPSDGRSRWLYRVRSVLLLPRRLRGPHLPPLPSAC